ncbi:hypothetical protein ACVBEQ_26955 [Nakamurella sp. GG22]
MWDRWKNVIVGRPPATRPVRAAARLLDLAAVPVVPVGHQDGLRAVSPQLLGSYLGYRVVRVEQLDHDQTPSLIPRQQSRRNGDAAWCLFFESGSSTTVRLNPIDDPRAVFPVLQSRFRAEQAALHGSPKREELTLNAVCEVAGAPYETYYQGNVLSSRGGVHEALVTARSPAGPLFHQTMAGVAALALRIIGD